MFDHKSSQSADSPRSAVPRRQRLRHDGVRQHGGPIAWRRAGVQPDGTGGAATLDYPQRVKRVIFLFMNGGCSHIDSFDPKPALEKYDGQPLPGGNDQDRTPDRRADEVAVQVQKVRPVRHGRERTVAASGRSGRRYLLGPLGVHRHSQSRAVLPDDEHRRQSGGPSFHGRMAHLRAGHGESESSGLRGAVSHRADHRGPAAVEQRISSGDQPGHVHLEPCPDRLPMAKTPICRTPAPCPKGSRRQG